MDKKTVYVLLLEWACEGEDGVDFEVYDDYELARENLEEWINCEKLNTWIASENNVVEEKFKDGWEAYSEDFYSLNHTRIQIIKKTIITKEG
jgi:hypothetical protein